MLETKQAMVTLGVKSVDAARKFYEATLGLKPEQSVETGAVAYKTAGATLFVYQSQYAGTNQATAVTWIVGDDLDNQVRELRTKGVSFERYDLPNVRREGDVHLAGPTKIAWFKDPDGNIHALSSR
jgi:catechol 2,3-dioxygenase-like lactoylglutathione lyase family enzyme